MKKIVSMAIVALALMVAMPVQAQVKFGLKGGVNVTNMKLSSDVRDKENNTGFYIGPTVKFTLPIVGLGIDASALYDQRSVDITLDEGNEQITRETRTLRQKQIAVPINVRYGWGLGSTASFFLYAGPQFGFKVGGDEDSDAGAVNWKWKDSNFSVNVGLGVMLLTHLQLNANYNIACGHTGEVKNAWDATSKAAENFNAKSNSWQVGLAYYF